ncbi:signal peptidase complex subunit 3 isoform X2 [Phymastichus coffea]|nr:signal peptidase complex subunit 3 isoform X2 [Phymastichus coffea]
MHTFLSRSNSILAYTLSVSACLTFCCFLSTVFYDYKTEVSLDTIKTAVKNVPDYSASRERNDLGFVTFNLRTDLTSLFNWNVKQLFLFLIAEYRTNSNNVNQIILWDKIILRDDHAVLDFKNVNTKYYFWDDGNGLRGNRNITLHLSWNVVPNAGILPSIDGIGYRNFGFPSDYTTSRL